MKVKILLCHDQLRLLYTIIDLVVLVLSISWNRKYMTLMYTSPALVFHTDMKWPCGQNVILSVFFGLFFIEVFLTLFSCSNSPKYDFQQNICWGKLQPGRLFLNLT